MFHCLESDLCAQNMTWMEPFTCTSVVVVGAKANTTCWCWKSDCKVNEAGHSAKPQEIGFKMTEKFNTSHETCHFTKNTKQPPQKLKKRNIQNEWMAGVKANETWPFCEQIQILLIVKFESCFFTAVATHMSLCSPIIIIIIITFIHVNFKPARTISARQPHFHQEHLLCWLILMKNCSLLTTTAHCVH